MFTQQCNLLAPANEYIDPNPDLHSLFLEYNRMFFEGRLAGCEVKWSKRMTLCAGLCSFQPRSGFCSIRLSEPLLKLRPRSDLVNTLLHEMIHAFVFVASPIRDHEDHGPLFQEHMNRINKAAQTKITVFHTFHDEVASYRQHVWQCNGPCRRTAPYYGLVKRAMNRAPGPTDRWWTLHEAKCGGSYSKIKEPAEYTAKQAKKKERAGARKKKQDKDAKTAPSVKEFFPLIKADVDSDKAGNSALVCGRKGEKALRQGGVGDDNSKKRRREFDDDSNSSSWPRLVFPSSTSVIFSAEGDEDGCYLVGDVRALFQTSPSQSSKLKTRQGEALEEDLQGASAASTIRARVVEPSAVVDLSVSDSDDSDKEQLGSISTAFVEDVETAIRPKESEIIEID